MDAHGRNSTNSGLLDSNWASLLAEEAYMSASLTIGIVNGSRNPNDQLAIEGCIDRLSTQLQSLDEEVRCLLIRASGPEDSSGEEQSSTSNQRIPVAERSELGPWCEVSLGCNRDGNLTDATAGDLAAWLPVWKKAFRLILVDLGPIHGTSSRTIGRLCDGSYLLLGPNACGSQEWIMQQIAWHNQSGSTICGSLLAENQHTA